MKDFIRAIFVFMQIIFAFFIINCGTDNIVDEKTSEKTGFYFGQESLCNI